MARTFNRQTGVRDLGNHAESGEINFILGKSLQGLIFIWEKEE
jgi:hypothetical protein